MRWFLRHSYGCSLSGLRFEVALRCRYGVLVTRLTGELIVKPWEAIFSPVVLAAPTHPSRRRDVSVGSTPRSLYRPEAIGERSGIVQAMDPS